MELNELTEEKLEELINVAAHRSMTHGQSIQDALAELLARKAVGEALLIYLNRKRSKRRGSMPRSAIEFWANHIRQVKDTAVIRVYDDAGNVI